MEPKKVENKLSLLAGKLSFEKKVCAFEQCLVLSKKYTKSFGGKILALGKGYLPSKVQVFFLFLTRLYSNPQNLFSFRQPSIGKI